MKQLNRKMETPKKREVVEQYRKTGQRQTLFQGEKKKESCKPTVGG